MNFTFFAAGKIGPFACLKMVYITYILLPTYVLGTHVLLSHILVGLKPKICIHTFLSK
jgi:hypothetical protein